MTRRTIGRRRTLSRVAGRRSAALAAAAALCAVAALPGAAYGAEGDGPEVPAYRTADDAKARKGAASSADGPRLVKGGTYTDTLAAGEKKYYSVELDAKSSAWLSAVALPKAGSKIDIGDQLLLVIEDTDGTECARDSVGFGAGSAARPLATAVGRTLAEDDDCQEAGVYNLSVERESDSTSDPTAWPLELRFMQEPPVKGGAPTEPPETEDLPTELPEEPTGEPERIKGGTGFNDAVGMDEGVWKDRIRPGETRFYRMPVDWGQQPALSAEFGTAKGASETFESGGLTVDLYNPVRGRVDNDDALYRADEPAAVTLAGPPVDYPNRFSFSSEATHSGVAGWYYVAVHAKAELADDVDGAIPVTLRTSLIGKAEKGPGYRGDPADAGFGVSADDKEQAADGVTADKAAEGDGGGSDSKRLIAFAGIGAGTVLLLVLGTWMLLARRRAAPVDAVPPYAAQAYGAQAGPYGTLQQPTVQQPGQQPGQPYGQQYPPGSAG